MGEGHPEGRAASRIEFRRRTAAERQDAGEFTMRVHFDRDPAGRESLDVADRFVRLVRLHPSLRVLVGLGATTLTVAVRFSYHSELELTRVRDLVFWLLELSGRATSATA